MATVTLDYSVPAAIHRLASLRTKVEGVKLAEGELDFIGMFVQSDTTVIDGTEIKRTVVLETTAQGDLNFPDETSLKYATKNLYKMALSLKLPGSVVAADPVAVV
jgi:hypothetical protein